MVPNTTGRARQIMLNCRLPMLGDLQKYHFARRLSESWLLLWDHRMTKEQPRTLHEVDREGAWRLAERLPNTQQLRELWGYASSPPTQQQEASSAEPPNLGLQATVTCAQQGVPTSSAASADKPCISSPTELKQITPEQSPVNLLNIPQVIYFWCRGEGGRKAREVSKPSLCYQQGEG